MKTEKYSVVRALSFVFVSYSYRIRYRIIYYFIKNKALSSQFGLSSESIQKDFLLLQKEAEKDENDPWAHLIIGPVQIEPANYTESPTHVCWFPAVFCHGSIQVFMSWLIFIICMGDRRYMSHFSLADLKIKIKLRIKIFFFFQRSKCVTLPLDRGELASHSAMWHHIFVFFPENSIERKRHLTLSEILSERHLAPCDI